MSHTAMIVLLPSAAGLDSVKTSAFMCFLGSNSDSIATINRGKRCAKDGKCMRQGNYYKIRNPFEETNVHIFLSSQNYVDEYKRLTEPYHAAQQACIRYFTVDHHT